MKKFNIPDFYRSSVIKHIKELRQKHDPKKKDFSPTTLDFGPIRIHVARHFGFCFGVENAIEISYRAIYENPKKRIFLLSQMIHNPDVNEDLLRRGIKFIMDTNGNQLIPWDGVNSNDIVIIPAFGTTLEILDLLEKKGVSTRQYNTTCPFVTRVWKRADQLSKQNFTIIIHGKYNHEETRATYSYSKKTAPSLIIKNMKEAIILSEFILGKLDISEFDNFFKGKYSDNFNPKYDLNSIGVINQTTMLASDTQAISNFLKETMDIKFGQENSKNHMANTRDTLCYATNENQDATYGLLEKQADLAIIVGGYNSSNTSHLVELCEKKLPSFFISNDTELINKNCIQHYDYSNKMLIQTKNFLPRKEIINILITSGASCPDTVVEKVLEKLISFYPKRRQTNDVMSTLYY